MYDRLKETSHPRVFIRGSCLPLTTLSQFPAARAGEKQDAAQGQSPMPQHARTWHPPPRLAARLLVAAVLFSCARRAVGVTNCTSVYEWQAWSTDLSCGSAVISSIDFAHYGTPKGPDDGSACNHTAVAACDLDVSPFFAPCMWKHSCSIVSNGAMFHADPCPNVGKRTVVKYSCSFLPPANPTPPLPPPSPPASPPPPPEPPGSPTCARLPPLDEHSLAADIPGSKAKLTFVSLRSLAKLSAAAPFADPSDPATTPFDCVPPACRTSFMSPDECAHLADELRMEKAWDGVSLTSCGADHKGWRLDWGDIVIGISVQQSFLGRLDQQASVRPLRFTDVLCPFNPCFRKSKRSVCFFLSRFRRLVWAAGLATTTRPARRRHLPTMSGPAGGTYALPLTSGARGGTSLASERWPRTPPDTHSLCARHISFPAAAIGAVSLTLFSRTLPCVLLSSTRRTS